MKRYGFYIRPSDGNAQFRELTDGDMVRFEDAQAEFQRLMDAAMELKAQIAKMELLIKEGIAKTDLDRVNQQWPFEAYRDWRTRMVTTLTAATEVNG